MHTRGEDGGAGRSNLALEVEAHVTTATTTTRAHLIQAMAYKDG